MYISQDTPTLYTLTGVPISNWLFGVAIVTFLSIFFSGFFLGNAKFTCKRSTNGQGECVLVSRDYQKTFSVNELLGAKINSSKKNNFTVTLLTKNQNLEFGNSSTSNYSQVEKVVEKVNWFASNPDAQSLQVDNSDKSIILISAFVIFMLVAFWLIFFSRIIVLKLDKNTDSLKLRWIGLIPKKAVECKLSSIKEVTYVRSGSSTNGRTDYSIMLITNNGEEMPLNDITSGWSKARSVADNLNDFLGINERNHFKG